MSGSFNQRRVAEIIRASQAEWRQGYDLGKRGEPVPERELSQRSISFRDGYWGGWEEFFGKQPAAIKPAPPRLPPEEEARVEAERGKYVARHDSFVPEHVLAKCHPAFREAYERTLRYEEDLNNPNDPEDDEWFANHTRVINRGYGY